ncbi:MAG: RecX family transcriptional regulator [Fimbriimonadaceae bacterium]|nr:RecX family transcriptional regulator [Fimbriimonadaceae bacterium]
MKPLPNVAGDAEKALLKALRMLKAADKLSAEVEKRLLGAGFSAETTALTLQTLREGNLIDDLRTVEQAIKRMSERRGLGKERVRAELVARGAEEALVDSCLAAVTEENDAERALALLRSKPEKDTPAKAARFLISRGFSEDIVREAVEAHFGGGFEG